MSYLQKKVQSAFGSPMFVNTPPPLTTVEKTARLENWGIPKASLNVNSLFSRSQALSWAQDAQVVRCSPRNSCLHLAMLSKSGGEFHLMHSHIITLKRSLLLFFCKALCDHCAEIIFYSVNHFCTKNVLKTFLRQKSVRTLCSRQNKCAYIIFTTKKCA